MLLKVVKPGALICKCNKEETVFKLYPSKASTNIRTIILLITINQSINLKFKLGGKGGGRFSNRTAGCTM